MIGLNWAAHAALVLIKVCLASVRLAVLNLTAGWFLNGVLVALGLSLEDRLVAVVKSLWDLTAGSRILYVAHSIVLRARHFL